MGVGFNSSGLMAERSYIAGMDKEQLMHVFRRVNNLEVEASWYGAVFTAK